MPRKCLHNLNQPRSNLMYQHSCLHQEWTVRYVPRKIHPKETIHIKVLMNWKLWNLDLASVDIRDSLALQIGWLVFKILYNKFHKVLHRINRAVRMVKLDKEMVLQMRNITKSWVMLTILNVNFTKLYHNQFTISW